MTDEDSIEAEIQRILGQPVEEQLDVMLCMITAMTPDRRERVLAWIRDNQRSDTAHAVLTTDPSTNPTRP